MGRLRGLVAHKDGRGDVRRGGNRRRGVRLRLGGQYQWPGALWARIGIGVDQAGDQLSVVLRLVLFLRFHPICDPSDARASGRRSCPAGPTLRRRAGRIRRGTLRRRRTLQGWSAVAAVQKLLHTVGGRSINSCRQAHAGLPPAISREAPVLSIVFACSRSYGGCVHLYASDACCTSCMASMANVRPPSQLCGCRCGGGARPYQLTHRIAPLSTT